MYTNEKLDKAYEAIKEKLEPGIDYHRLESAYSMGSFYKMTDGKMDKDVPAPIHWKKRRESLGKTIDDIIWEIKKSHDPGTSLYFTLNRENGLKYEFADARLIVEALRMELAEQYKDGFKEEAVITIVPDQNPGEPEIEIFTKFTRTDGSTGESDVITGYQLIKSLYHLIDNKLATVYINGSSEGIDIQTIPEIPGITKLYAPVEDLILDTSKIDNIYAFLESFSEAKMEVALQALKTIPKFRDKAEKRYQQFIKARVGENADLNDFPKAALTRTEVNLLSGKHFERGQDFISFSYFDKKECQAVVHFFGSLILNHINPDDFAQKAEACADEAQLRELYTATASMLRIEILKETKKNPEGWFSKLSILSCYLRPKRVMFEKTDFSIADSPVLRAFILFLNLNQQESPVYLDVFQSYLPELTKFFWFLPHVPVSSWGDTELAIPESTLSFKRTVTYRLGDDCAWKNVNSLQKA